MYKVLVMSFDGEYRVERPVFDTVSEAELYASDMGSKWYFYPFQFVVTESVKTVVSAPAGLGLLEGKRVNTILTLFKKVSEYAPDDMYDFIRLVRGELEN